MPREACQSAKALQAKPTPCITCRRSPTCLVRLAQRNLFEAAKPLVNITHVVSACDAYEPADGLEPPRRHRLSIVQSLASKGVSNLCTRCGDAPECDEHHRLDALKRAARANGIRVHFTVVCCSTRPEPALIQISEP